MQDLQEDQALFGEEGRILGVTRSTTRTTTIPTAAESGKSGPSDRAEEPPPGVTDDADLEGDGMHGGECYGGQCGTPGMDGPDESGGGGYQDPSANQTFGGSDPAAPPASVEVEVTETQAGQVPVGVDAIEGGLEGMSPARRIRWLKKRRLQVIEQIKKLQILHDRIQEKADSLEEE
jgi:hypothetical protein